MPDWASLSHAYGPAGDIPELLTAAGVDPDDRQTWDALWGRLCHQGTIYSASYPALPALAAMAARRPASGYIEPVHLAAAIVAANDGPEDFDVIQRDYADEFRTLRSFAEQSLHLAEGFIEFVYGLQTLMALEGATPWGRELEALAAEELTVECPGCGQVFSTFDPFPGSNVEKTSFLGHGTAMPTVCAPFTGSMLSTAICSFERP
ncbi:MAG TPA: hypothetical protein VLL08_07635 [Kineosporiaceae bacterium]|nr:hypothetical protein [Kineosporiaceae bacterium]